MDLFKKSAQNRQSVPLFTQNITKPNQNQQKSTISNPILSNQSIGNNNASQNTINMTNGTKPKQGSMLPNQNSQNQRPILFKQLYKIIEQDEQKALKIMERQSIKSAFRLSLQYFDRSPQNTSKYEKLYSKALNFGFGARQMGEQCRFFKNQKIDFYWKSLVENSAEIFNVSQLILSRILGLYLNQHKTYTMVLTLKQFYCGNFIRVPHNAFIQNLFNTNPQTKQRVISLQSQFFLQIFNYFVNQLYSQYLAMLKIIQFLQLKAKKYFKEIVKKSSNDYIKVLWKKLKQFSVLGIRQELQQNSPRARKIKQFFCSTKKYGVQKQILNYKIVVKKSIANSLLQVLNQYGSWVKQPTINTLIDYKQAIKFMDSDLICLTSQYAQFPYEQYKYATFNLYILLNLIPLHSFCKIQQFRPKFMQIRQIQSLRKLINQTKSPYLQSFRFLAWFTNPNRANQASNSNTNIESEWLKIPKNVIWMMRNQIWSEWLGIFLSSCQNGDQILDYEEIRNQVIRMSKMIIQFYIDSFWSQEPRYQLELIKNFIISFINDKGIQSLLPVLIKCLGNNESSQNYTRKTLQLIPYDSIRRQIRDALIQTLKISDKHNYSPQISMFYSQNMTSNSFMESPQSTALLRSSDIYPQQQLKFLCRMIKNLRLNLQPVQSILNQCQAHYSTGILVCKFLLECLSKLRECKVSSLKCMRYIVSALDTLFVNKQTRSAFLIALSLVEQFGQPYKNQLYDMVSFACMKQSFSQQYRQSQKLKTVIAHHLCNITRLSKYVSQYFPLRQNLKDQRQYFQVLGYANNKNFSGLYDWYIKNNRQEMGQIEYKISPWYMTLLLTLQGPKLLPVDYETIKLLIQKMRVQKSWQNEYICLQSIVEILNKVEIFQRILETLQPSITSWRKQKSSQSQSLKFFMFGLANYQFLEQAQLNHNFVDLHTNINYKQDEVFIKRKFKTQENLQKEREILVGNIAGSFQILITLLGIKNKMDKSNAELSLNTNQLYQSLKLYSQVVSLIVQKSQLYHYKLPLSISVSKNSKPTLNLNMNLTSRADQTTLVQLNQPCIAINLIQILASYINFECRYGVKLDTHWNKRYYFLQQPQPIYITDQLQLDSLGNLTQTNFQSYSFNNLIGLNENQLTMTTDYTIGIGCTLRLLQQIMLMQNGCTYLFKCLQCTSYSIENGLLQLQTGGRSRNFGNFLRQVIIILGDWELNVEQKENILEFLIIGINQSYYFVKQILQTPTIMRLRRTIKQLLDTLPQNPQCLAILNKISLLCLVIMQNFSTHPQQVDIFIKYPTSLIQDILNLLVEMHRYFQNAFMFKIIRSQSSIHRSTFSSIRQYRKMGWAILYKGTIGVCLQMVKKYYYLQSMQQQVLFIQTIMKISQNMLWIPPKPNTDYISSFKLQSGSTVNVAKTQQICLLQNPTANKYRNQYGFQSLAQFIGFLPSVQLSYGRNYKFCAQQLLSKCIYAFGGLKNNLDTFLLEVYHSNYQMSLSNCHEHLLGNYLTLLIMIGSTGQFGHLLCYPGQDLNLLNYDIRTRRYQQPSILIAQHLQTQNQSNKNISPIAILKHIRIEPNASIINILAQYIISIILTLRQYLQKDHSKQYSNDLIIYTMSIMLNNLTRYFSSSFYNAKRKSIYNMSYSTSTNTPVMVNKLCTLVSFVFDSMQINMKVSAKIYTIFIDTLVTCCVCCRQMYIKSTHLVQKISELLQTVLLYGTNQIAKNVNNSLPTQQIYNQYTLQSNIFLICLTLSKMAMPPSWIQPILLCDEGRNRDCRQLLVYMCNIINDKYLTNTSSIDITNMSIISLLNTTITAIGASPTDLAQTDTKLVSQLMYKYIKYLNRSLLNSNDCCLFNSFLLTGFTVVHEGVDLVADGGCRDQVMGMLALQFGVQTSDYDNQQYANSKYGTDKQQYVSNYARTASKSKPAPKLVTNMHQTHFHNLLTHQNQSQQTSNLTLSTIVEIKQLLTLLGTVCEEPTYWNHPKHANVVESIFNSLVNQQFMFKLVAMSVGNSGRVLGCRLTPINVCQQNLANIQIDQMLFKINNNNLVSLSPQKNSIKQKKSVVQGKKTNLFEFTIHIQILHTINQYLHSLGSCMGHSQNLKRYYNKILSSGYNQIDQYFWQKISNTFIAIFNYFNEISISYIRFYPKSLAQLLIMYTSLRNNTDFGYDCDFLNVCMGDAGISQNDQTKVVQEFKDYVMDILVQFCQTAISFVEIWKSIDWKSNVNWSHSRNKLINMVYGLFREGCKYICSRQYQEMQTNTLDKVEKWFLANQSLHQK